MVIDIKNDVIKRINDVIKNFLKKTLDKPKNICYTKITVKVKTTKGVNNLYYLEKLELKTIGYRGDKMNEEYRRTIENCLNYLTEIYNTLHYDAWEEIQLVKCNCTQSEQLMLEGFQSKIDEAIHIINDLSNDMERVLTDEILKGVMDVKCTNI